MCKEFAYLEGKSFLYIINADEERGEVLYDIRNKVKRFQVEGVEVVVKRYGHITAFNRLMYSTFRKSKAMRAYRNASRLKELGIDTPEGVAVLETFKHGILQNNFFISLYKSDRSLSFLRDYDAGNQALYPLLDALLAFEVKQYVKRKLKHCLLSF